MLKHIVLSQKKAAKKKKCILTAENEQKKKMFFDEAFGLCKKKFWINICQHHRRIRRTTGLSHRPKCDQILVFTFWSRNECAYDLFTCWNLWSLRLQTFRWAAGLCAASWLMVLQFMVWPLFSILCVPFVSIDSSLDLSIFSSAWRPMCNVHTYVTDNHLYVRVIRVKERER